MLLRLTGWKRPPSSIQRWWLLLVLPIHTLFSHKSSQTWRRKLRRQVEPLHPVSCHNEPSWHTLSVRIVNIKSYHELFTELKTNISEQSFSDVANFFFMLNLMLRLGDESQRKPSAQVWCEKKWSPEKRHHKTMHKAGTQCPGNYTSPDYQRCAHALTHDTFCTRQRLHFYFILLIFCWFSRRK